MRSGCAVFFGEQLPQRFFALAEIDFPRCDLCIVLGTSLKVHPFASLVGMVPRDVPRLLINREEVGTQGQPLIEMLGFIDDRAFDFNEDTRYRDAHFLGDCDEGTRQLAQQLDDVSGWAAGSRAQALEQPSEHLPAGSASSASPELSSHRSGDVCGWVDAIDRRISEQPLPQPKSTVNPYAAASASLSPTESAFADTTAVHQNPPPCSIQQSAQASEPAGKVDGATDAEDAKADVLHQAPAPVAQQLDTVGPDPTDDAQKPLLKAPRLA